MPAVLQIIHISDTHFGPDRSYEIRGGNVFERAEALVEAVNGLSFRPDLVVHTGDVVYDPDPAAYALAAETLSRLEAPVYYVVGNHDDAAMMREALSFGPLEDLLPGRPDRLCYRIAAEGTEGFELFVVDAKVPPAEGPHGFIPDDEAAAVLDSISGERPVAVFLHYPLGPIGSDWIDRHLPVRNGTEFQRALAERAGGRLRGLFSGHVHRGVQIYRDGVLQSGVSSPVCEFTAGPEDDFCEFLPGGALPFHHVTLTEEATQVKAYSLPFPPAR